jgi:HlyD family secretion protein
LTEQHTAKGKEIDWIGQELAGVRELWRKNLVQFTRVSALERESARLEGEVGQLVASVAQAKGRIAETELKMLQIDEDLRAEVSKDLAELRTRFAELAEKRIAAEDQLKRVEIRAPVDGIVHQLSVHTIGGVVNAGEPIMLIVPSPDELTVEARVPPQDIDQVRLAGPALVRFSSFNVRTTPELHGVVTRIAADVTQDTKTGASYYFIRINLDPRDVALLDGLVLVPGMPAEVMIHTRERTIISFLTKPLMDQVARTFRER